MENNRIPIVVIRSNDKCFLDVLRCCGVEGIPVVPVVFTWKGAGQWYSESSKYFKNPVTIVNPAENEKLAIEQIAELGEELKKKYGKKILIIPTSDTSHVFIQNNFKAISHSFIQMGDVSLEKDCLTIASKDTFANILVKENIDTPKTIAVKKIEDIEPILDQFEYPCIYKPILKDITNSFQNSHNMRKAIECADKNMLKTSLINELSNGYELIVQEKIEFNELNEEISCYAYSDAEQNIRMFSGQHKLDEFPKPYGTGYISKFCFNKELFEISKKLVKALKWRGFIGIEFMKDKKSGKWKVIEANLRPWLSIYFQAYLGFNYISYLYQDAYNLLPQFNKTLLPLDKLKTTVYRLNLSVFINKMVKESSSVEEALNSVYDWFSKHNGQYFLTGFIPHDPNPGIAEIENIKNNYSKEIQAILQLISIHLKVQDDFKLN